MTQRHHEQYGIFHVTTNAKGRVSWCVMPGVPEAIIGNIVMTRNMHAAKVFAFCILPDHVHVILSPGPKGLSAFMHSFKRNSSKDIGFLLGRSGNRTRATEIMTPSRSRGSATPADVSEKISHEYAGWHNGFHDERIRDRRQCDAAMNYVRYNAWRHGIVSVPEDWPWSSSRFTHLMDGVESW